MQWEGILASHRGGSVKRVGTVDRALTAECRPKSHFRRCRVIDMPNIIRLRIEFETVEWERQS
jgi:hypothetical protein